MVILYCDPYVSQVNQHYREDVILRVTKEPFEGVKAVLGRSVVPFANCSFTKLVIENAEAINFEDISISFSSCYIEKLEIENITSGNITVTFMRSVLSLAVMKSKELKSVSLSNNIILSGVFVSNVHRVYVKLAKANIHLDEFQNDFDFIDFQLYLKQAYYIYNCEDIHYSTDWTKIEESIPLNFQLAIHYGGEVADKFTEVKDACLTSLTINGSSSGTLRMENITVGCWYIRNFSPKEDVSFFYVDVNSQPGESSKLEIHHCNMDKVWFDNVRFDRFSIISPYQSKLSKTNFTGCTFPEESRVYVPVENVHYPDKRTESYSKDQYELFLQLKNAMESTGNAYEAYKFQVFSLQALQNIRGVSWQDRSVLALNEFSNRHGLSVGRPLAFYIILSIFLYILYLACLGRFYCGGKFDPLLVGHYFSFVDPTHRNDFLVDKKELTGGSLVVDYAGKILLGYLIYQFIAAFRKYSKKTAS